MKTDQEKIAMCILFLEKRGYGIARPRMSTADVASFLSIGVSTLSNWTNLSSKHYKEDFPKPKGARTSLGLHFDAQEIAEWANKRCDAV